MRIEGIHSANAKTHEWITPRPLIEALGAFDMDPCAAKKMPWPTAETMLTIDHDGLANYWTGDVWCNPPYGKHIHKWLYRASIHKKVIALIFARTDTRIFHEYVFNKAHSIYFLEGRIKFFDTDGREAEDNAGAPSCLVSWHPDMTERLTELEDHGYAGKLIVI